jgi:hypothetical protein
MPFMKRKIILLTFAIPALLFQNLVAQTSSRLVAKSDWTFQGAAFKAVDSTYYNYSGSRGGDLKHQLKYDNFTTWDFLGDTAYRNAWNYVQTFDSSNNLKSTVAYMWNASSSTWVPVTNTLDNYDTMNRITTMILQTWNGTMWVPSTEHVYSYNSSNELYLDLLQNWNAFTTNWDPASQKTYYYDASNKLINETDQVFIATVPTYTTQYAYTYSTAKNTTTVSTWSGTGWVNDSLYTNTFDSTTGNRIMSSAQSYNASSLVWTNGTLHLYSNFVSGLPQTDVYQKWDSAGSGLWVNVMQFTNTYNSYNQLTSSTGSSWNIVGLFEFAVNDPMSRYYYATYSTSVKNVLNEGGDVNIYPVPAQNMLHVDLKWTQAQTATISMYDMQGRVVRQWDTPLGTRYNGAVSVNDLTQGTYFMKITGAQGQIVKQLVIAH